MSKLKTSNEEDIKTWKMKRLIKQLRDARGGGTSVITLIVPPGDQISRVNRMLTEEHGKAKNIKSRVNRQSVQSAIVSAQSKLKQFKLVPENGLALFCGSVEGEDGKERKVNVAFEPPRPLNTSKYLCDNKFHTEALEVLLQDSQAFGFIIVDGSGCLYGTLAGSTKTVLEKFTVDLPKKHNKGGQSSVRFARLRNEARHNYLRKVSEKAKKIFLTNEVINVTGIILAGSAEFKKELGKSELLDHRVKDAVINIIDIAYGGMNGFNQAIKLSTEFLSNVKLMQEKKVINQLFETIRLDNNKFCFGVNDTIHGLTNGIVDTLILWEDLDHLRYKVRDSEGMVSYLHLTPKQSLQNSSFIDKRTKQKLDIIESESLSEWITENYKKYSSEIVIVTDQSQEGSQFVNGFGGIAALLRYAYTFESEYDSEEDLSDFEEKSDSEEDSDYGEEANFDLYF
ncbi:eukaryotic peptide chain release factor subunit 1 [Anaeramoeba flamelloides]|uniref:Eukaryotic peptide chain release factor subunit 1 n=1 Tax=Anaeramoeba flamelloides TaxID=1746091 RepID=A0ABQ8XS74_9EUKA|nr:eukaryotic peptide chain release factor subunit 1 [Anaeramoeba flamelloides]